MTNNGKFTPETKKTGDPVRSADWNAAMQEIVRLETAKIKREGAETLEGSLTITEALNVSAIAPLTNTSLEIKGPLKLSAGVAIDRFSSNADLSDNSDSIVSTQKAVKTYVDNAVTNVVNATVKTYVDTTREGSETQNFQAKDLRVYGNLVVEGSTVSKSTEKMEGNVELGNDDGDIITVFGRVRSGHSSGFLQVHTPLQITENLMVDGNIGIGTTTPTDKLSIQGGAISFYNPDHSVPYVGLDYDKQSDGLRIRGNQDSTSLNTEYIIIKRVSGNVGIGTTNPNELLHIYRSRENAAVILQRQDGGTLKLKAQDTNVRITFDRPLYFDSDEVGTTRLAVTTEGKIGIGTITPGATLEVNGTIRAKNIESTNPFRYRMYPNDPIVYQDIFAARDAGAIAKLGNPYYNDTTHTTNNLWNDRPIIAYGTNNETDGNGAVVTIPDGYNTVWVRVLGERWNAIAAYLLDKDNKKTQDLGIWTGGYRQTNCYCPDGSLSDSYHDFHQWLPIPIAGNLGQPGGTRKLALISKPNTNSYLWLSGLAFSKNPWSHATQSAVGYHWKINGGDAISWSSENWNGDVLAYILPKTNLELKVPIVPSGRDKLLYLVEHNNNWNGCMHSGITVNGKSIERFIATYENPFARHWNNKIYERYIAARIPADLIPDSKGMISYLSVKIDMSKQKGNIHFRELGTHDLEIPGNY